MTGVRYDPRETRAGFTLLRRPLVSAVALEVLFVALIVIGSLLLSALLPALPGYSLTGISQSLVLVGACALVALGIVAALRWWRVAGFTPPSEWRDMRLYWLPLLLLALPLVAGVRMPSATTLALLLLAYLLTGVFEETLWRGVMIPILRPLGIWPAVLISSLLFGLGHIGNSALRGVSAIILLQAFGAAVQGIGLAALRLRTNSIWPLIGIHALHDLALQVSNLPLPLVDAVIATILAVYGVLILRGRGKADLPQDRARSFSSALRNT